MTTTTSAVAPGNAAANTRPQKLYTSRKASSLPVSTVEYLKAWMMSPEHIAHPYPTEQEKRDIMAETGINQKQLTNWFVNNRKRFWRPRVKKAGVTPAIPTSTSTATSTRSSSRLSSPTINKLPIKPERVASSPTSVSKTANKFCPTQARVSLLNAYVYHQKGEDAHAVSEGSSAGSDDESVGATSSTRSSSSSTTTPFNNKGLSIVSPTKIARNVSLVNLPAAANDGGYRRNEEVEVHILRPEGSTSSSVEDPLPTIRDLTIKSSVPENRILATFKCPISYTIPKEIEHDKKKIQTRRDGEVLKMKKHYLKLYLATRGIHSVSTPVVTSAEKKVLPTYTLPSSTLVHSVSEVTLSDAAAAVPSTSSVVSSSSMPYKKRFSALLTHTTDLIDQDTPRRKRARTSSGSFVEGDEEWKQLCTTADSYFCDSLPSMEEASRMFGYA